MALPKLQDLDSSYKETDDKHQVAIPALYYSSGVYPSMDKDKVGAFDFSSRNFPEYPEKLYLHSKQYDESIQATGFPPACIDFLQDLRASTYILFISHEIDEQIIGRVILEFETCSSEYGNNPRQFFIVTKNEMMNDYINGHKQYPNALNWVDIRFSDKLEYFYRIHDRFAILDDHVWHFGVGIGGMHKTFHALSGPWEDVDHSFRNFCEKIFF